MKSGLTANLTPEQKKLYDKKVKEILDQVSKKIGKKCKDAARILFVKVDIKQAGVVFSEDVLVLVPKKGNPILISSLFLLQAFSEYYSVKEEDVNKDKKAKTSDRGMIV